jgi:MOSC domain-containing protein YiiM
MMGRVEAIHIAPAEGMRMQPLTDVAAVAGVGLEGDRYAAGIGHYSANGGDGRHVTLIEAEVLDDLATKGIALTPNETRRNLTTRGIGLNGLVGQRFRIGDVECIAIRLCEPCAYLQDMLGKPVLEPLVHRGGLRAEILVGGRISVGDAITVLDAVPAGSLT